MNSIIGRLYTKSNVIEIQTKKGTPFFKRTFIVDVFAGAYSNWYPFECSGDCMSDLDRLEKDDQCEVIYEMRGRKYTGKDGKESAFLSLQATAIKKISHNTTSNQGVNTKDMGCEIPDYQSKQLDVFTAEEDMDSLPF